MKKILSILVVATVLLIVLTGCSAQHSKDDFLGKSSAEIITEFGAFDCTTMPASEDGLYRNCRCGYTIKEPKVGFLGTSPEELYFIVFDSNGIAIACEKGYRPGG